MNIPAPTLESMKRFFLKTALPRLYKQRQSTKMDPHSIRYLAHKEVTK